MTISHKESNITEKTVIVTGGSHGIGRCVVDFCAKNEYNTIVVARNEDDLKSTVSELDNLYANRNEYYSLDVSDYQQVQVFADSLRKRKLTINGLINCAGIYGPIGKLTEIDIPKYLDAIKINLMGTVNMCALIVPLLSSDNRAKIINYSGGGAASSFPFYSAYATSKVAIARLTENLSVEFEENEIDVNCVAPGFVNTRIHQETISAGPKNSGKKFYDNTIDQIQGKSISPNYAAELSIFLLSKESDFISGKFISAPWDNWREKSFQQKLKDDKDFATIRRIDDKTFFKHENEK